jgi:hypothetical protein
MRRRAVIGFGFLIGAAAGALLMVTVIGGLISVHAD